MSGHEAQQARSKPLIAIECSLYALNSVTLLDSDRPRISPVAIASTSIMQVTIKYSFEGLEMATSDTFFFRD